MTPTGQHDRDDDRSAETDKGPVLRAAPVSRQQNRILALTLAAVAALVLITAVTLVVVFTYMPMIHGL